MTTGNPDTRPPLVVSTMTLARSVSEAAVLERSLERLAAHGWPVVVADGGSLPGFVTAIEGLPNVKVCAGHRLVGQIQGSMAVALDSHPSRILYTEPDKELFFQKHLMSFVAGSHSAASSSLCIAARSAASFSTYPAHQRHTEGAINAACRDEFGSSDDFSYGPFVMPARIAPYLMSVPADVGWGWRHVAFAIAHRLGHRLVFLEGDFDCPPDQRHEGPAERAYRDRQNAENKLGLSLGLTMQLG